uniref:Toxin TdNa6 n=1 Tax=Tityus discrepans TaxID=57059 RepID=SCNA6_TITDI|nr:RecName: Full=Toxin TdNa6; AltName: Full=PT-Arthr*-beta* NaTx1.2; Flags: Precursor [Tityus discrepans]CAY61937.1 putative neurotoxin Na6 precursor [Tityus discrepans]
MKGMIMLISCLMLIEVVVGGKEGYLLDRSNGCKRSCFFGSTSWCNTECKSKSADKGYCAWPSCYCYGFTDDSKMWHLKTNKC